MAAALEAALARHRAVSIVSLTVLTLIAWAWLFAGAGMEMDSLVSLAPVSDSAAPMSGQGMAMPMPWSAAYFGLVFSMWWVMMVAMMVPSAAPTILLYARVAANSQAEASPSTGSFLAGYLIAWGAFSLLACFLQFLLQEVELLAPMLMGLKSHWLSATVLIAAGIYQLSPFKDACLRHCRSPAQFLSQHHRPGAVGALRMGLLHGTVCLGCCWLLMALLFVGGIMNLAWIALLTLMVAAEKLLPFGRQISIAIGLACMTWGAVMLVG